MSNRLRPPSSSLRAALSVVVLAIGPTTPALTGQVPVALLDEPGALNTPGDAARTSRALAWREKVQILTKAGIPVPARPPMEFALTPAAPARFPGGHLSLHRELNREMRAGWNASTPYARSGRIIMDGAILYITLADLKPNTRYVVDVSMTGATSLTVYQGCGAPGTFAMSFPNMRQQEHALIVTPTTAAGDACMGIPTGGGSYFHRVDVSEIGPVP